MNRPWLTFAVLFSVLLGALPAASDNSRHTLRIGAVLGLTGPAAEHSAGIRGGIDLAVEDLRSQGWDVDVDIQDDQTNSTRTVSAVQFHLVNGRHFIIGPVWSFLVKAARSGLERGSMLALVPGGSSDIVGGSSAAILNLCPLRSGQLPAVKSWLMKQRLRSVYILTSNGDWGETHRAVFRDAAKQAGLQIIGEEQFDVGMDSTFFSSVLRRPALKDVDLVMTTGTASDVANVVRARKALKRTFTVLTTDHIRDALRNHLVSAEDTFSVALVGLPVSRSWRDRFQARYPDLPVLYSDRAYDAVMLLAQAIKAGDGSVASVRSYLQAETGYTGASGPIAFDALGNASGGEPYRVVAVGDELRD